MSLFEGRGHREWGHSTGVEEVDSSRKLVGADRILEEVEGVLRRGFVVEPGIDPAEGLHRELQAVDIGLEGDNQIDCTVVVVVEGNLADLEADIVAHKGQGVVRHTVDIPVEEEEPRMVVPEAAPEGEDILLAGPGNTTLERVDVGTGLEDDEW